MDAPPDPLLTALMDLLGPRGFTRDRETIAPWLTDWRGRYRGQSAAMLSPDSVEEVEQVVRLCAASGTALVPQGGNTSMVGGATPDAKGGALLLSLRRMSRIRTVSAEDDVLIAEAGVTLAAVHEAAAAVGRRFALSLAAKGSATIGGLASTNAGGTQVLRHGRMRALIAGVEAVLASGDRLNGLTRLKKDNRGYDVGDLLVGAEGTLGIITAVALRLVPAIGTRAVAWIGLDAPNAALALLRRLQENRLDVESFEVVPAAALALVLAHIPDTRSPLATGHRWHVLVEAVGTENTVPTLRDQLAAAASEGLIADATIASSEAQADALWRLRESISEAERIDGPAAKHDISVPIGKMPDFLVEVGAEVEARFAGTRVIAFGHLGDGNIHFNVRAPIAGEIGADSKTWLTEEAISVTRFIHDQVVAAGGSISAEHGIGQMKLGELARTSDPVRLAAQAAIKRALDPANIMNPGKLVPTTFPAGIAPLAPTRGET